MKPVTVALDRGGLRELQVNPDWAKLPLFDRTGWKRLPFGAFAQSVNDRVEPADAADEIYVGLEHLDPQDLHIRRWGRGSDVIGTKLRFRKGDLIFGRRRAYQRKVAVAEFDGICSAHAMVVRAKSELVLPEFLAFLMMSDRFMRRAVEISVGSLSPTINWTALKLEEFLLPPVVQQRRIAEILWALHETNVKNESLTDSLRALHLAVLDTACSYDCKQRKLGDIVVYASDGPFGSKLKTEHYAESGARVIRLQNVGNGYFDDRDKVFIALDYFKELSRYDVRAGDVIVAGLGDETHAVGRAALIPDFVGPAVNKADCFCLRADEAVVLNGYLTYFLNSTRGAAQIASKAQGSTRLRINVGNIKTVLVPVPPLDWQAQLLKQLSDVEQANANIAQSVTNTKAMMGAFLNRLFGT